MLNIKYNPTILQVQRKLYPEGIHFTEQDRLSAMIASFSGATASGTSDISAACSWIERF